MTDQTQTSVPPTDPAPGKSEEKTFTQNEVDALIRHRLEERKSKYADYDELKAAAEKLKTIEDAQKSETQKLQERLASLEKQANEATTARNEAMIKASAIAELGKHVPADRVSAAYKLLDKTTLKLGDGDTVDGLTAAISTMLTENAFLKEGSAPPPKSGEPRIAPMNPAGGTNAPTSDLMEWHPLRPRKSGGGFGGLVIPPPGEGKK